MGTSLEEGAIFGRLRVLGPDPHYYRCRCECGTYKTVREDHLASGRTASCGCLHREKAGARADNMHRANRTHGRSKSRIYDLWRGMRERCENPKRFAFEHYGGRGITVCDRWRTFENFLADMGEPPRGYTLERTDNNGPYSPENCRWATRKEQSNNRRINRRVTINGQTKTLRQWSDTSGIPYNTIRERLERGRSPEDAISHENFRLSRPSHCKRGHALTPDNVYQYGGSRSCKACFHARKIEARQSSPPVS